MTPAESDRRTFLTRLGLFSMLAGAAVVVPAAANAGPLPSLVTDLLRQVLDTVSRETYNALTVFAVPGPDTYSAQQGTPRSEPGALEARAPDFMLDALDHYMAAPDALVKPVSSALASGLHDVPIN